MPLTTEWTYYAYGNAAIGERIFYYRYRNGVAQILRVNENRWMPVSDNQHITNYIQRGETDFNQITRRDIERALGFTLPD